MARAIQGPARKSYEVEVSNSASWDPPHLSWPCSRLDHAKERADELFDFGWRRIRIVRMPDESVLYDIQLGIDLVAENLENLIPPEGRSRISLLAD